MNRVRAIRESKGVTQRELGRRIGMTDSAVSRIESGERKLSSDMIQKIAQALRIGPAELIVDEVANQASGAVRLIPVVGAVSASTFKPHGTINADDAIVPVLPGGRYRHIDHVAYKVDDDSAKDLAPKGSFLIAVPFTAVRRTPIEDDILVISWRLGALECYTVAKVQGRFEPNESMAPLPGLEPEITGLVVAIYTPLNP